MHFLFHLLFFSFYLQALILLHHINLLINILGQVLYFSFQLLDIYLALIVLRLYLLKILLEIAALFLQLMIAILILSRLFALFPSLFQLETQIFDLLRILAVVIIQGEFNQLQLPYLLFLHQKLPSIVFIIGGNIDL